MARSKTYPRDVRERAVALVFEQVKTGQYGSQWEAICSVAAKIGASGETVRKWVRQAEVDDGQAAGVPTETARELRELRRKNRELEATIEILKAATTFFARECDPLHR